MKFCCFIFASMICIEMNVLATKHCNFLDIEEGSGEVSIVRAKYYRLHQAIDRIGKSKILSSDIRCY